MSGKARARAEYKYQGEIKCIIFRKVVYLHLAKILEPHKISFSFSSCPSSPAEPHTPSGLRAPPKSCQHNGTMYQHGEIFSVPDLFPARLPNQCVLCSCTVRAFTVPAARPESQLAKSTAVWVGGRFSPAHSKVERRRGLGKGEAHLRFGMPCP